MDKKKDPVITQKKDNENLLHWLRVTYAVILFLLVIYYAAYSFCNPAFNSNLFALALIVLVAIALILKSPPLALIVIAMVAIGFYLGPLCPPEPTQCTFSAGIVCVQSKLWANTGKLSLQIGQGIVHPIRINGVVCTQNTSSTFTSSANVVYNPAATVNISSGGFAYVADKTLGAANGLGNVTCTDVNNMPVATTTIGTIYNGKIYVNYTELDTGLTKIVVGTYTAKYEA